MIANKSWADITPLIGGVPLIEVREIQYKTAAKKEDHYGVGNRVVSRGYGNIEDSGLNMKMSFDELKRLEAAAPNGDITQYPPFVTKIVWKPTAQNSISYTDTLSNCEFTTNGRDLKMGETKHFTTIEFIYSGFNL